MSINHKWIKLLILVILALSVIFVIKQCLSDNNKNVKLDLIDIFKQKKEYFNSIIEFIQSQEGDFFSAQKSSLGDKNLVVNCGYTNEFRRLELEEYAKIYTALKIMMYDNDFSKIYKIHNKVFFMKEIRGGKEQGIVFSINGEKPDLIHTENLEGKWYYYFEILE